MSYDARLAMTYSVKNACTSPDGEIEFTISPVMNPATTYAVVRDTSGSWYCSCLIPSGNDNRVGCQHIGRAKMYYVNMMARTEEMKQKAKKLAEDIKQGKANEREYHAEQQTPLLGKQKRKIKLEE